MAEPGFYDDRERAEKAAADHKALMWEVGDLMGQWECCRRACKAWSRRRRSPWTQSVFVSQPGRA